MVCADTDIVSVKVERIKKYLELHYLIYVGLVHFQINCFNVLLNNKNKSVLPVNC